MFTMKQVPPTSANHGPQGASLFASHGSLNAPNFAGHGPSHRGTTPSRPSSSQDVEDFLALQLKQVQFSKYKGMDKGCNKDAVHTFLQKWIDIHHLRATPDWARPMETSSIT